MTALSLPKDKFIQLILVLIMEIETLTDVEWSKIDVRVNVKCTEISNYFEIVIYDVAGSEYKIDYDLMDFKQRVFSIQLINEVFISINEHLRQRNFAGKCDEVIIYDNGEFEIVTR